MDDALRLLHTSDWHLGHSLHNHDRAHEHAAFLAWLLDQLEDHAVDALLIAGDIFDTANPSAAAQAQWYQFLSTTRARLPALDIVVIGGNHDSAARLDAVIPMLAAMKISQVGGARRDGLPVPPEDMVAPLTNAAGEVAAWVAAVPYLRLPDLPRPTVEDDQDPVIEGVREAYRQVFDVAFAKREANQAIIGMGHCYMSGTELSDKSERRILVGNQHALPVDIFPESVAYTALGHLHKPQKVGRDSVRYCGSPIPLSMSERTYKHQVLLVDLEGAELANITVVRIPRTVDILRVPLTDAQELPAVLQSLSALPAGQEGEDIETWPFLEVHVRLKVPEPGLRTQVEAALEGRRARLVRLATVYTGTGAALTAAGGGSVLGELSPEQVFELAWARQYSEPPGKDVLARFGELEDIAGEST